MLAAAALAAGCLVPPPAPPPPVAVARPSAPVNNTPAPIPPTADDEHDPGRWFAFPARGIGSPTGAIDLSSLDDAPAGSRGFIRAGGGHFVDGSGQRVRFFGVNCTATACFPTHDVATRAALHLRRLGVNVVRFHFMDKGPAPIGLLTTDRKGLDPAQLERLDFFVAELARNGIYANLNLHVARRYPGLDGAAAQRFDMGKMLDRFYPPFIESQKDYARALLTHVNPYTKHAYVAEPAVLCVEMNNENTALPFWSGNLDDLPEPFAGELRRQWNVWLKQRYRTTARLKAAWSVKREPIAEMFSGNLSASVYGWTFESAGVPTRGEAIVTDDGARGLRFAADRRGTASWHLQFYRAHLPLEEGERYHVTFRVRAPAPNGARALEVTTMLSVPDWRNIGLGRTIAVGPDWQKVDFSFRVQGTVQGEGRLNFSLRNVPGVVEIADLYLLPGAAPIALGEAETVERGTVPLVRGESGSPAGEDFLRFLADTDRATARALAGFLRKDLGLKSMLVDTQASYGGLEGLRRELEVSDFVDTHAYWQHPDFPSGWNPLRFAIPNTTQVTAADGGALGSLAVYRVAGKPFTVSEYNVPAPNDSASETLPMYAAIAAFQDWDAIYAYTYLDFSPRWDADHLLGFFDLAGNPAALCFLPVAALAFRTGLVAPGRAVARLALPLPDDKVPPLTGDGALARLWTAAGLPPSLVASRRMEIAPGHGKRRLGDRLRGYDGGRRARLGAGRTHARLQGRGARAARRRRSDRGPDRRSRRRARHRRRAAPRRRLDRARRAGRPPRCHVEEGPPRRRRARREHRHALFRRSDRPRLLGARPRARRICPAHRDGSLAPVPCRAARSRGRLRRGAPGRRGPRRPRRPAPRSPGFSLVPAAQIIPAMSEVVADPKTLRRVIVAASLGTLFEWYDFYLYGSLGGVLRRAVLPAGQRDRAAARRASPPSAPASACGRSARSSSVASAIWSVASTRSSSPWRRWACRTALDRLLADVRDASGLLRDRRCSCCCACCRGSRSAASTAAPRPTSPSTCPTRSAATTRASSRPPRRSASSSRMGVIGTTRIVLRRGGLQGVRLAHPVPAVVRAARRSRSTSASRCASRRSSRSSRATASVSKNPLKESFANPRQPAATCCSRSSARPPVRASSGTRGSSTRSRSCRSALKLDWKPAYLLVVGRARARRRRSSSSSAGCPIASAARRSCSTGCLLAALTYVPIYMAMKALREPDGLPRRDPAASTASAIVLLLAADGLRDAWSTGRSPRSWSSCSRRRSATRRCRCRTTSATAGSAASCRSSPPR